MSPNQDETGLSLPKACGLMNHFVKLELVSQHTKVQVSALQNFADVFVDYISKSMIKKLKSYS